MSSPFSWLSFLLTTLTHKALTASDSLPPLTLPILPFTVLQTILTFSPPKTTLTLSSTCVYLFHTISTSFPLHDNLHHLSFGCYLPLLLPPSITAGAAKTLYFDRLFRSIRFANSDSPRLICNSSMRLKTEPSPTKTNYSLPPLSSTLSTPTPPLSSLSSSSSPFCSLLCPPPHSNKFDNNSGNDTTTKGGYHLFLGTSTGHITVYPISIEKEQGNKETLAPVTTLHPPLPENILSLTLSTNSLYLFAGGDNCASLRCWSTQTFAEVPEVHTGTHAASRNLQQGSFDAYSLTHHATTTATEGLAGSVLIGNVNSTVVIYDVHAAAVSAVLLPPSGTGDGACRSVIVGGGATPYIIGLVNGGNCICLWASTPEANGAEVWDACPEIENSVVVRSPVRELTINLPSPHAFMHLRPTSDGGSGEIVLAVGSCSDSVVSVHTVVPATTERSVFTLKWSSQYTSLENTTASDYDPHVITPGSSTGVSSLVSWGSALVVGSVDGFLRVFTDPKEGDVPAASFEGVGVRGICPVTGLHSFGAKGRHSLALVSVGWDRTVRVFMGGNEEVDVEKNENGVQQGDDLLDMYADYGEEEEYGEDERNLNDKLLAEYEGYEDGEEGVDSEEDDAEGDGEGDCEGDVSDSNWKDDEYYAPQLTDRSNFSVDEAKAEINKVLAGGEGGGVPSSVEEPKKENRDWRSAMAAMDDYLSQNK